VLAQMSHTSMSGPQPFPKPQLAHWFHLVPPPWACCDDLWVCITGETRFSGEGEWKPTYSDAYPSALSVAL
jgi:hypothetical protein